MIAQLDISGAFELTPSIYGDNRGTFREWFKESAIQETFPGLVFRQSNISTSKKGTIRGIHFSLAGNGQTKLVTCMSGRLLDVAVDIRIGSPSYGKYVMVELAPDKANSLLIDGKLGHAFIALEENTTMTYLLSSEYDPKNEYAINPKDETIDISWPVMPHIISEKDLAAPTLLEVEKQNLLPRY